MLKIECIVVSKSLVRESPTDVRVHLAPIGMEGWKFVLPLNESKGYQVGKRALISVGGKGAS